MSVKKQVFIIFVLVSILLCLAILSSCQKSGSDSSSNNGNNKNQPDTTKNTPPVTPPAPMVTIAPAALTILLPDNCTQSFTIKNTGPQGSSMDYTIKDDGALGGFLTFTAGSGTLAAGASVTISVNVKPGFINGNPSLIGSSLVLNVYTPKASNYLKIPVAVKVKSTNTIMQGLVATWSGTWSGTCTGLNNPGQPAPNAAVGGTWEINIASVDTAKGTATGTLKWAGADNFWTYTTDNSGTITSETPNLFTPDRTISFDATNTTITSAGGGSCGAFHITINGFNNAPNPSDAFYGPWFNADFNVNTNKVTPDVGNGFSTHPYNPANRETFVSSGSVTGAKK